MQICIYIYIYMECRDICIYIYIHMKLGGSGGMPPPPPQGKFEFLGEIMLLEYL